LIPTIKKKLRKKRKKKKKKKRGYFLKGGRAPPGAKDGNLLVFPSRKKASGEFLILS